MYIDIHIIQVCICNKFIYATVINISNISLYHLRKLPKYEHMFKYVLFSSVTVICRFTKSFKCQKHVPNARCLFTD